MKSKTKHDLPELKEFAKELIDISKKMVNKKIKYLEDDHLGFMALCFLSDQCNHLQNILKLLPNKDVNLLSRSMYEGLVQLLWAAQEPTVRPLRWRLFAFVHDWRNLQKEIEQGNKINTKELEKLEEYLQQYGEYLLTKKAEHAKKQGQTLPQDPYCKNWKCNATLKQIDESVSIGNSSSELYEIYGDLSGYHHWDIGSRGRSIKRQGNVVSHSSLSAIDSALAVAIGIQCLWQTVNLVNSHLQTNMDLEISEFYKKYTV